MNIHLCHNLLIFSQKVAILGVLASCLVLCLIIKAVNVQHCSVQVRQSKAFKVDDETTPRLIYNAEAGEGVWNGTAVDFIHGLTLIAALQMLEYGRKHVILLECYGVMDGVLVNQVAETDVGAKATIRLVFHK